MKKVFSWIVMILLLCVVVPASAASVFAKNTPTDMIRISNDTRVRVRSKPESGSDPIGWADSGLEFPYLGTINGWFCIDFEGRVGYVSSTLGSVVFGDSNARYVHIVNPNGVNIRAGANSASKQIGKADAEDIFLYMDWVDGWFKINYCGVTGYVSGKLSAVSSRDTVNYSADSSKNSNFSYDLVGSTPTDYVRITNSTKINVRKGPSGSAEKLGSAEPGSRYKFLGSTSSWNIVEYNGAVGYISKNLCAIERENNSQALYAVVFNPYSCNIRAGASEVTRQIGKADQWDMFLYMGHEGDWYKVFYNGGVGYMSARLTLLTDGSDYYTILD